MTLKNKRGIAASSMAVCATALQPQIASHAQDTTWQGTNNTWDDGANWSNGIADANTFNAIFNDPSGVSQPEEMSGRKLVEGLTINNGGWDIGISGGTDTGTVRFNGTVPSYINFNSSTNLGTVRIGAVEFDNSNGTNFNTAAGNTLIIDTARASGRPLTSIGGDGTVIFSSGGTFDVFPESVSGTFLLNGSAAYNDFNTTYSIQSGGIMGGSGSVDLSNRSFIEVLAGGGIAPGVTSGSAGTFSIIGSSVSASRDIVVNFNFGSTLSVDIFANGTSDTLLVTNNSTGQAEESVTFLNIASGVELGLFGSAAAGTPYTIASITDRGEYDGSAFSTITLNGTELTEGVDYNIAYNAFSAGDAGSGSIVVTIIPEPGAYALLLGASFLGLALLRRRT